MRLFVPLTALALLASPALADESDPAATPVAAAPTESGPSDIGTEIGAEIGIEDEPDVVPLSVIDNALEAEAAVEEARAKRLANDPETVSTVIDASFGTYDADGSGDLNLQEFSAWMTRLRVHSMADQGQPVAPPDEVATWAEQAFLSADTDRSTAITRPELSYFLRS